MIKGTTKLLGVIGYPIAHSLSPVIQNAALAAADIDCAYVPLCVEPEDLPKAVDALRTFNFIGANVTVPYKEKIMKYLDEIDEDALKVGAVNTLSLKDGKIIGYNTDVDGFSLALTRHKFDAKNKNVIVFGAGGAARAIIHSLIKSECANIIVGTRNEKKVRTFVEEFKEIVPIEGYVWNSKEFRRAHWDADLIVNTTPVGMEGVQDKALPVYWTDVPLTTFAADIVYRPAMTAFLRQAQIRGCRGMNGLAMLVEQGALSFEIWLGTAPQREIMYEISLQNI